MYMRIHMYSCSSLRLNVNHSHGTGLQDYSYQPNPGRSLALQTWLMQETGKSTAIKERE